MARVDELWIKVLGVQKYLCKMDDDSLFWLAAEMADTKFRQCGRTA